MHWAKIRAVSKYKSPTTGGNLSLAKGKYVRAILGSTSLLRMTQFDEILKLGHASRDPTVVAYAKTLVRNLTDDYFSVQVKSEAFAPTFSQVASPFDDLSVVSLWYRQVVVLFHVSRQATLEDVTRAVGAISQHGSVSIDRLSHDLRHRFYADNAMFTVKYNQERLDWSSRKASGGYLPMTKASSNLGDLSSMLLNKPVYVENETTVVKVYLLEGMHKGSSAMAEPASVYSIGSSPGRDGKTTIDFFVTLSKESAQQVGAGRAILKTYDAAHNERAFNMVVAFASHMWRRCNNLLLLRLIPIAEMIEERRRYYRSVPLDGGVLTFPAYLDGQLQKNLQRNRDTWFSPAGTQGSSEPYFSDTHDENHSLDHSDEGFSASDGVDSERQANFREVMNVDVEVDVDDANRADSDVVILDESGQGRGSSQQLVVDTGLID